MARKQHTPEEKAKLVLEAFRGERTINEIAFENNIHPNVLSKWKRKTETNLFLLYQDNFVKERKARKEHEAETQELYAQIGKLTTQNEWLKKIWSLIFLHLNDAFWRIWMIRIYRYLRRHSCWS